MNNSCLAYYNLPRKLGYQQVGYTDQSMFYVFHNVDENGAKTREAINLENAGWFFVKNCTQPKDYWIQFSGPDLPYFPANYRKNFPDGSGPKNNGEGCHIGNPVNTASGNKYQKEVDIPRYGISPIEFVRHYNSATAFSASDMGNGWSHTYSRSLRDTRPLTSPGVSIFRPDGKIFYFIEISGEWVSDGDVTARLEELLDANQDTIGWRITLRDNTVETYNASGRLETITDIRGITQTMTYTGGRIDRVDASTGGHLIFGYDTHDRINSITHSSGRIWSYSYDESSNQTSSSTGNLEYVVYPDATPTDITDNPRRQYHYEDPDYLNALTGITDERGIRYSTYEYSNQGRVSSTYHSGNANRIDIVYNDADGTRTVSNSRGVESSYATAIQLGVSLVTEVSGPGCSTCGQGNTIYDYDPDNNTLLSKTENGVVTRFGNYDSNNNFQCKVEGVSTMDTSPGECDFDPLASPDARRTDYTYDLRFRGKIATITEPSVATGFSKITTYTYDDSGNRTSERIDGFDPQGNPVTRTTTYEYNGPLHQPSLIDGPLPNTPVPDTTSLVYYPDDPLQGHNRARLKQVTGPLHLDRNNIQYTATGQIASEDRLNGLSLTYTYYPGNDRLQTLTESDGTTSQVTRWTYLATGEVESITTADGTPEAITVIFGYDAARRLIRVTDGLGNYIEYQLDTEGNIESENARDSTGILKKTLVQSFDIYNRLDTTSQANEGMDYDFAPNGTLDRQTDGNGRITDFAYDDLKRLLTSTRDLGGLGAVTRYAYDVADRLTQVIDPVDGTTTYEYDDLGNLLRTDSPDTGTTTSTYDAAGNLDTRIDATGQSLDYTYDALGRLADVDAPGTADDITYEYDICTNGLGRLCSATQDGVSITYAYDAFGNITAHQQLTYSHDAANRLKTMTYPSGAVLTYHYDAAGQVDQVDLTAGGSTTTLAGGITYTPFGSIQGLTYGNGAVLTQTLDTAYRLTDQSVLDTLDLGYTAYDANGNLEQRDISYDQTNESEHFSYDPLNRLDTGTGPFGTRDYDYDLNGNRTQLTSNGQITDYGYLAESNRLDTEGGWSYTLDPNGNTTHRLGTDGLGRVYTYNSHNRLVTAAEREITGYTRKGRNRTPVIEDLTLANYAYNGLGQRVRKTLADGTVRQFLYGTDGALLAELDGSSAPLREYIYLNGQLLAVLDQAGSQGSGGEEFILDDGDAGTAGTGSWTPKTSKKANDGEYLLANGGTDSTYRWTPALTAGFYDVYVWYVKHNTYSSNVSYSIVHDGLTEPASLDQSSGGNAWYPVASGISFDGSGNEYVEVSDASGKTTVDAVKFVRVGGSGGTSASVYHVHNDHLGTPQAMTDNTGAAVWRAMHDPFGLATVTTNTVEMNVRFPGQYFDQETGLHYNYFRYYDQETGRYITSDPIGLDVGPNTYAYAELNPVRYTDELGLFVKLCSRRLGDKNKPATSNNNPFRHDFLNVSGTFVGFQAGDNWLWSQGRVEIGRNIEFDGDRCHTMICNDDEFDQYVLDAARSIPPPTYCVLATKSNIGILLTGARNCQTWALDVIEKAKEEYQNNKKCPQCFN